jgi:uncharacterized protein YdaU (DUF1376 family)
VSKRPVLPLWVADFLADTQGLSQGEVAAYLLLLMAAWVGDGSLPDDDAELQRIARAGRRWWGQQRPRVLERFFAKGEDGRWRQNAKKRPAEPVENPVQNLGTDGISDHVSRIMYQNGQKPNKNNGRSEHMLTKPYPYKKKDSLSSVGQSRQAAPERKINFRQARAAWEAELAERLGPIAYADALDRLAADPALCERATAAEQRAAGSGAMAAILGLQHRARRAGVERMIKEGRK